MSDIGENMNISTDIKDSPQEYVCFGKPAVTPLLAEKNFSGDVIACPYTVSAHRNPGIRNL